MAVVDMRKLSIVGLSKDRDEILKALMKIGCCQINSDPHGYPKDNVDVPNKKLYEDDEIKELETQLNDVERALEHIKDYDIRKKSMFATKKTVTDVEFEAILNEKNKLLNIANDVLSKKDILVQNKSTKNTKTDYITSINPWESLDIPLELTSTKKTTIQIGTVPSYFDIDILTNELNHKVLESYCEVVNSDSEQIYVLIINHVDFDENVRRVLKNYKFKRATFQDSKGTVRENILNTQNKIIQIEEEIKNIETSLNETSKNISKLEMLYDYLLLDINRKKVFKDLFSTKKTFVLEGWLPSSSEEKVKSILEKKWEVEINIQKPLDNEPRPVLLDNKGIGSFVEPITKMFSLPDHREVDPNAVMSIFFILFFGLMLSDGGYGIIMALVATVALVKFKLDDEKRKIAKLTFACGISTMFWGALFGGWFGIPEMVKYGLWFNPVKDPQELLKWSLAFGILHIFIGFGVKGVNLFIQKKYKDIVFDVLFWYVFLTGFALFSLPFVPKIDAAEVEHLVVLGKYLLVVGGILLILTQGRKSKNVFMKFMKGVGSLYDVVGFMSDVLSYSRLLALGLATSVIASIVNEIAIKLGLDNVLKILFFVVIVTLGHTFNFALNALGAYVHSSRLQYIEFFGKFYKGGGKNFEPFRLDTKYINIQK